MLPLLFASMLAAATHGVVVKPVASMYSHPTEETDVVSQAIYGTNVDVIETQGAWLRIRTPDDYTGWLPQSSLLQTTTPYAASGNVAQVNALFANLYREPNITRHQPLIIVPFETRLEVVAEPEADSRRYLQVRLPDDRAAWIQRGDITQAAKPLTIDETIELARRFLGLPYLWGGTSSYGFDCSGFMQMLCRRRGITLPRDAQPQADWSGVRPVEKDELEPGDLLYFGSSPKKITHTGMYIGGGRFIHATAHEHPVVQISNLGDPYWTRLLVAQRRPK